MISIINLVIIGIFVVLLFVFLRMDHAGRKIKVIGLILVGLLLYFSIMNLFASKEVNLASPKGIVKAVYLYFGWIGKTLGNLWDVGVETTGKVIGAVSFNNTG